MKKINNLTENFEDELETILRDEGIIDENGMVYADHVIAAQPFSSKDEKVEFVENECIGFIDDEYIYICKNDGTGDYGVERVLITKHSELLQLVEENEDVDEFESYDVSFKIVSNRNPEVYTEGYVTINDEEAEDVDWYYYDAQGMATSQMFVEHDGVDGFKGATDKQRWEVEQFKGDYGEDAFWIDECILQSDDDENKTHVRENLTLIINEGAEMECEVTETNDGDYWGILDFKFNGKRLGLDEDLMEELAENIDSTYAQEERYEILNDTSIACEISKNHYGVYEDDEYYIEETNDVMKSHIEDAKKVFAKQLVRNLGVYSIASRIYEEKHGKLDESGCDKFANNWEQGFESDDVAELYLMTEEDVERIIKEELEEDNY